MISAWFYKTVDMGDGGFLIPDSLFKEMCRSMCAKLGKETTQPEFEIELEFCRKFISNEESETLRTKFNQILDIKAKGYLS